MLSGYFWGQNFGNLGGEKLRAIDNRVDWRGVGGREICLRLLETGTWSCGGGGGGGRRFNIISIELWFILLVVVVVVNS